jgi:23S rRNA G2445 N2-methylase RlmL
LRGSDISQAAVNLAKEFAVKADVTDLVEFSCAPAEETKPHASCGLIIINPPYGERIGAKNNLPQLYKNIGNSWKNSFPNWTSWLLSSNESLTKSVGLRSTRKFSVYNGNLECRFLQYVMYPLSREKIS